MSVSARERCQRVGCRHPESSHEPASRDQRDKLPTVCRDASGDDLDDCLCAEFVPKHAAPGGDGDPSREQDTRPTKSESTGHFLSDTVWIVVRGNSVDSVWDSAESAAKRGEHLDGEWEVQNYPVRGPHP